MWEGRGGNETCSRVDAEPEAVMPAKPGQGHSSGWFDPLSQSYEGWGSARPPSSRGPSGRQALASSMHTFHHGTRMDGFSALSPDLKGGGDFSQPGSSAQTARAWAPLR